MGWEIETSDEFVSWYEGLSEDEIDSVDFSIELLEQAGPVLGRPHVETRKGSKIANLKELRVQHEGRPLRILFVFDPRRIGYLILGGDKTGSNDGYTTFIPRQRKSTVSIWRKLGVEIMANKWREIRRTRSPEREAQLRGRVEAELAKLPLGALRRARSMTQDRLAELLHVNQGAVSKMEKRTDMYLSTLRSYIEAMGGSLDIRAVFPDGEIVLEHIAEVAKEEVHETVCA
jgi:DNA-binding XRE family transcriptional regulator